MIGVTRDVRLQNRDAEIPLGLSQMRSSFIGVFPLLVVGLPPVQVGLLAALWWPHLARPWLFLVLGLTALYGMVGLLACWVFGNIGIAGKSSAVPPEARPLSIDAQLLFGFVAVVVVGSAVLFGLKVLFAKG